MGTGHCSLWCLDVLNEDQTKAPLASNGFGGQAKWWPCCTKPRPLKPGPKQTSSYTNGASCKVCINQGNVLFHMILVSRRSRRFLSFQFKSNLISMFKQRKTSPKISEASYKVSKHPQSSNADSHHVVTFLCFAWTWYSGHILSRIYSGSQTGLFLHLLPVMHCLYHSKFIGMVWKQGRTFLDIFVFKRLTVDSHMPCWMLLVPGCSLKIVHLHEYKHVHMQMYSNPKHLYYIWNKW